MPQETTKYRGEKVAREDNIDIDMISILQSIGRGISNALSFLTSAIKNYFLLISVLVGASIAVSYVVYKTTKPYYTSSMTLVLANIRNEFIEDQLDKLSDMIDDDNFETVANRLDITADAARQVKEMKFINLDQDRIDEDSVLTGSPFRIELTIYEPLLFESLEPAITNYLENNRYFARQKSIKQKQVENLISKLKEEISSIDSMKTNVSEPKGPVGGFVYGQPIDPTNLYRESITMYKEQVELESDLEKLANVEIVTGFTPRLRPTGPSLIRYLAISGLVGLLLGIIVAINLENKKRKKTGLA
ncbi:chain length determinant protein [Pontibacter sp. BT731]|uniref:chain length determinant protein n=1 Tax=Pontibacter coccineus TaxID=3063328 RepID=UPI0026E29282|nr:chain length determinant protein [Pontibacter sp. BT731]MDO6391151.1 chain length determinant protein [Pontibacter sp. BT731]